MQNINKKILFFLSIFYFISCTNKENKEEYIDSSLIKISTENTLSDFNIDEIADFQSIIPLETTNDNLIGEMTKVILKDSLIVIFDFKMNNVLVFDTEGQFKYKIGSKGNGPKEYVKIYDIYLDKKTDWVYLTDELTKHIQIYNIKGDFISSLSTEYSLISFFPSNEEYWGVIHHQDNEKNNLILMNEKLKTTKKYFSNKMRLPLIPTNYFIENEKDEVFFHYPYNKTIYMINEQDIKPYLTLDFGKISTENIDKNKTFHSTPLLLDVYLHKNHLLFNFSEPLENDGFMVYNCYLSLDTMQPVVFKIFSGFSKEIPIAPLPIIVDMSDGKLIFQIVPEMLPESVFDHLKNTSLNNLTSESNPVLVLYKLH
jgi:hypothetical protein